MATRLYFCKNYVPYWLDLCRCSITRSCPLDRFLMHGRKRLSLQYIKADHLQILPTIAPSHRLAFFCKIMERVITKASIFCLEDWSVYTSIVPLLDAPLLPTKWNVLMTGLCVLKISWLKLLCNVYFARAFDTASHEKLPLKLQVCRINGQLLSLIMNFLRDRSQVTKGGHAFSVVIFLTSGIVQGSCHGLLLYLICNNDLVTMFDTGITPKLCADDFKLYTNLTCWSSQNKISNLMHGLKLGSSLFC